MRFESIAAMPGLKLTITVRGDVSRLLKMIRLICLQFHNDFSVGMYYNIF